MRIVNPHGTERSRAIQQDYALQSFRAALEREYESRTVSDVLLELAPNDRDLIYDRVNLIMDSERRHSWFSNMFRRYVRSLKTRQAIRSNIDQYLTVLFIAISATVIIFDISLYGVNGIWLMAAVPLASTGAI